MLFLRKKALAVLILFFLLILVYVQYWGYEKPPLGIDDANIYFVYMKNLASGQGLVWNKGGEKVEGFTSLLWTLTGAFAYKISPVYFSSILLGLLIILTFFTIYITVRFIRRLNGSLPIIANSDIVIMCLLLLPLGFIDWNILSLMETGLWTFLITSMVILLCSYYSKGKDINLFVFSVLVVFLDATRPESIAFNLLFIFILFSIYTIEFNWRKGLAKVIFPLLVHVASVSSLVLWRLSYFGYALPNTYYAKVSNSLKDNIIAGINYLFLFFYNYPFNIFILLVLLFFTVGISYKLWKGKNIKLLAGAEKINLILIIFISIGFMMPLITGGDHFKYNRFYQMLLPVLYAAICNQYCWSTYIPVKLPSQYYKASFLTAAFCVMILFSAKYTVFDFIASQRRVLHYPVIQDFIVSKEGREVAEKMNEAFSSLNRYPSVGTLATGGFAFIYKGETIDLMGLNNTKMAHANSYKVGYRNHASFDKNTFYLLKPDMMGTFYGAMVVPDTAGFVLPENKTEFRTDYANMVYGSYKKIYDDKKFQDTYIPALIHNPKTDFFIFDYFNREYLASVDSSKMIVKLLEPKFKGR